MPFKSINTHLYINNFEYMNEDSSSIKRHNMNKKITLSLLISYNKNVESS